MRSQTINNNYNELDPDINLPLQTNFQYYTVDEFKNDNNIKNCLNNNYFSALHCNIRSLNANFDHFSEMLHRLNHEFSIIGLTEIKIRIDSLYTLNNEIPGYKFISQPSLSNAGGVGLYINENLSFLLRSELSQSTSEYESIWIEVQSNLHENMLCGVVYRHPRGNASRFLSYINDTLEVISKENKTCTLLGDFNLNLLNFETHLDTHEFINILSSYFYSPHIIKPTRITYHSATLIDNIFVNSLAHHTISGNLVYDLTDHLPNFIIINKFTALPKNFSKVTRDYSNFDPNKFCDDVRSINWEKCFNSNDSSESFDYFYSELIGVVDSHIPLKILSKRKLKQTFKPWITQGIRKSIQIKNKLYKKFLKTRSTYYHNKFKMYRNKLNQLIKSSKNKYFIEYFNNNKTNIKYIWSGIRKLITNKSKGCSVPSKLIIDGNDITDSKDIANAFNNFFTNVGTNLAQEIPAFNDSPFSFMGNPQTNSFFIRHVTSEEISKEISKLNPSKSTGPYSIPINILILIKDLISPPLQKIFNCSFDRGIVPEKFKIANVIPAHKKGSELCVNNYRPISLLSVFNKLLEKMMFSRLMSFINHNNILFHKQFGFRKHHSTLQAVLSIADKIQTSIDSSNFSCGIFLDLSKAFDTVNHKILLDKLSFYGIRGNALEWFKSYLSNRKQFVSIGNVNSDMMSIPMGVPQGSVLGPLLFLLYLNDLPKCSSVLDFHLFADDTNLFYSSGSLLDIETTVRSELELVHKWLCCNQVSLNIEKSNYVIFHAPQKKTTFQVNLSLHNIPLKQESTTKYLGILIDENLNWKSHISYIESKIKRGVGVISKLRHTVTRSILINLYYSLIYPYLIYGLVSWGNTYNTTLDPLFNLQKKVVRLITFSDYRAHSNPLFHDLNILKIKDLVKFQTCILMHDYHHDKLPKVFKMYFSSTSTKHKYNTRFSSKDNYSLPLVKTNYGKFNIRFAGAALWNSLDENLKKEKKENFKSKLFNTFISSYK